MPEMIVWPVSSSVRTRKVGSSSDRRPSAVDIFSSSTFDLGSMATSTTGSGNVIASRMIGWSSEQSVSPVVTRLKPMPAAMSPASTSVISSRLLACICTRRPMRSLLPVVALSTVSPVLTLARVDAEEGQLADVRVGHDLERQRGERRRCRSASRVDVLERLGVLAR